MGNFFTSVEATIHPNSDVSLLALWFVDKQQMSHKKIQKLCFYSQVWSLLTYDTNIVPNIKFEAWAHGPVCPELYQVLKKFGWRNIAPQESLKNDIKIDIDSNLTFNQKRILEYVWETYGGFDADELESMTHHEDPWLDARKGLEMFEISENEISADSIKEYYSKKYEEFSIQ